MTDMKVDPVMEELTAEARASRDLGEKIAAFGYTIQRSTEDRFLKRWPRRSSFSSGPRSE